MKTSAQELFLQAQQQYEQKEYNGALDLYQKIPQKTAGVWYNMGNCAYKKGDNLHALLYWKRAQKMDSSLAGDCIYNIALVSQKMGLTYKQPAMQINPSPVFMQLLFFGALATFLITHRRLWRFQRYIMVSLVGTLVIATGIATYASYRATGRQHALTMNNDNAVYTGPDSNYHQLTTIAPAQEVTILTEKKGWKKIKYSGQIGWIQNENIEAI